MTCFMVELKSNSISCNDTSGCNASDIIRSYSNCSHSFDRIKSHGGNTKSSKVFISTTRTCNSYSWGSLITKSTISNTNSINCTCNRNCNCCCCIYWGWSTKRNRWSTVYPAPIVAAVPVAQESATNLTAVTIPELLIVAIPTAT